MPRKKLIAIPDLMTETSVTVSCRMPESITSILDNLARRSLLSRSDMVRGLVLDALRGRGHVTEAAA